MRIHGFHASRPSGASTNRTSTGVSSRAPRFLLAAIAVASSAGLLGTSAAHGASGGGTTIKPSAASQARQVVVRKISCVTVCSSISSAKAGATLRFQGPRLNQGKRVVYLGGAGSTDDVKAQLRVRRSGKQRVVTAVLPKRAKSGPVAIEVAEGARSKASDVKVLLEDATVPVALTTPLSGPGPFFPIVGKWTYGTGAATFGGGRDHQGFDVFAKCGTPLVASLPGKVKFKAAHARAGNYFVYDTGDYDLAYMHLAAPATVKVGDELAAGQPVGLVGDTGRASGCHLHLELWKGNWQGVGGPGAPVDPLPTLKQWEKGVAAVPARR